MKTIYYAEDGKQFTNREECLEYEKRSQNSKKKYFLVTVELRKTKKRVDIPQDPGIPDGLKSFNCDSQTLITFETFYSKVVCLSSTEMNTYIDGLISQLVKFKSECKDYHHIDYYIDYEEVEEL